MKKFVFRRLLPFVLTAIMMLSTALPALAAAVDDEPDIPPVEEVETPSAESSGPLVSGKLEGGVYTLKINAEALYEILSDRRITKDELMQFIPEEALNALKGGDSREALVELAANFITADDLAEFIALIPTEVLLDHVDLDFILKFVSIDEILSLVSVDSLLADVSDEEIEALVNSEALEILLNENLKKKVLTNEFISALLENSGIVEEIVSDQEIHDDLADLIDGKIVDKILANETAKNNLIALAESEEVLHAVIDNEELLHSVQDYLFSHEEKVDIFLGDPVVISALRGSSEIRAHVAVLIDPHVLLDEIHVDYEALERDFGITEEYIENNAERLGLTYEEASNYSSLEELLENSAINLEVLCEDRNITVDKLIYLGYVTDAELAHLISDNWGNVVNDDTFAKDIINAVGIHSIFEDFGRDSIINDVFGGYYGMITLGLFSEEDVVEAVGGYAALVDYLLPDKLDEIIDIVGTEKWKKYVDVSDIVDAAGGYSALLSMYTEEELKDLVNAIGLGNIRRFLTDTGAIKKIDVKGLAKNIISLAKDKKSEFKSYLREIFNLFTRILNNEFSTISVNGTVIYKYGSFLIEKILFALINEIPDLSAICEMKDGDTLAGFVISAPLRDETFSLGVDVKLVGDLTDLQDFLEVHKDLFNIDIDEELNGNVSFGLPEVATALYEKIIESEKIPGAIKSKILNIATLSIEDVAEIVSTLSDEQLEKISSAFADKADSIRDRAYEIIDSKASGVAAVAKAKAIADKVIDTVSDPESLASLLDKIASKLAGGNPVSGLTLFSFYDGNGSFSYTKTVDIDLYEIIGKVVTLPEDVLILFNNDMTVTAEITTTVTVSEMYKVTVIEKDGSKKEFFLPAGTDLGILKTYGLTDTNLEGKIVPHEDCTFMHEDILSVTFFDEDGNEIAKFFYSALNPPVESLFPAAPEKVGYTVAWDEYELFVEQDLCVYPVYTPIEYNFGYSVNGEYTFAHKITANTVTLMLPDSVASATAGYEFDFWFIDVNKNGKLDANDITLEKASDGVYKLPEGKTLPIGEDVVACAAFKPIKYTVSFYANGELYNSYVFTVEDRDVVLPATPADPLGYHFEGWFADLDGDGADEAVTAETVLPLGNVDIFASFSENEYEVYMNVDGVKTPMPDGVSITSTYVYLPIPEKNYYLYVNFFLDSNPGVVLIKTNEYKTVNGIKYYRFDLPENYVFEEGSICFSAEFTPINYSFGYSANGVYTYVGSININTTLLDLPDSVASATAGYAFNFWFLDLNKNGKFDGNDAILEKTEGGYKIPGDITLYLGDLVACADFKPVPYTVSFYANGELYHSYTFTVETLGLILPEAPSNSSGFRFEYWYADLDGDGTDEIVTDGTVLPLNNVSVYAKFDDSVYSVYTKVDGVITLMPDGISASSTCVYLNIPEKLYHAFAGYYLEGDASVVLIKTDDYKTVDGVKYYRFDLPANYTFNESVTYFVAEFTPIDYSFGYSVNGQYTYAHKINVNTATLSLPNSVASATEGYEFRCWFLDVNGNGALDENDIILEKVSDGTYKVPAGKTLPLGEDLVAYAAFKPIEYVISFHTETGLVYSYTFTVNNRTLVLPDAPANPSGFMFEYWYADLNGDGVNEVLTDGMTLPLRSVQAHAKFNESLYSVFTKVDGVPSLMPDGISASSTYVYLNIPEKLYHTFTRYYLEGNRAVILVKTNEYKTVDGVKYYKFDLPANYTFTAGPVYFVAEFTPVEYNFGYSVNGQYTFVEKVTANTEVVHLPDSAVANTGYVFNCWYFDVNGNGALDEKDIILEKVSDGVYKVPAGKTLPLGKDLVAYAAFNAIEYRVNFYVNGELYHSYTFTVETPGLVLPETPANPSGFMFDHWYADLNGDGTDETVTSGTVLPLGTVNIYASFNENVYSVYTKVDGIITLMPDGISTGSTGVYLNIPEKLYHTFKEYYLEGNSSVILEKTEDYKVVNGVKYYRFVLPANYTFTESAVYFVASFTPIKYSFGYSVNGQYTYVGTIDVNTNYFNLPNFAESATEGYEFDFWFLDLNKNGKFDEDDIALKKVMSGIFAPAAGEAIPLGDDLVACAAFKPITYTVYFYVNGAVSSSYTFNATNRDLVLPATPSSPFGYLFEYWYADLDGDGTNETVTNGTVLPLDTVNIYAKFSENVYSVYIKVDGVTALMPDGISVNSTCVYLFIPTKNHYNFVGYYLNGNASVVLIKTDEYKTVNGVKYYRFDLPENYTFTESAVYFVATFIPVEYAITFNDTVNGTSTKVKYNYESLNVALPTVSAIPAGKNFDGWFVDLDGDGIYEKKLYSLTGAEFANRYGNITAVSVFSDIYFNARFEAVDGFAGKTVSFIYGSTALDPSLIPAVPAKDGYDGQWYVRTGTGIDVPLSQYTLENKDITVYAKYERNRFVVTFRANGTVIGEVSFNKGTTSLPAADIPAVPTKIGFIGEWYVTDAYGNEVPFANYVLTNADVNVYAKYTEIVTPPPVDEDFTVHFVANNTIVGTVTVPFGTTALDPAKIPAVPAVPGYTGKWESYTLNDKDIFVNAVYTAIEYKAVFKADGKVIDTVIFTVNDVNANTLSRVPAVPEKNGYTGKWNSYTLQLNDIEINASYTVITYKATFMSKGQVVAIVNFTVNDTSITEPEVPFIEGLTGKWEPYTLGTADIVIYALYTDSEGNIVDPDEPVDPDKPDGPDTPDTPDEPDTEEKPDEDDEKKENKLIAWLIFLFLCIIILIVWIISGKDDDDDDGDENPEQPVVIPPAADIPEEAPVENIDIVPEVDVETADKLMTDAVAMTVIETVGGAGVGMKSIVNVCDINKAFSDGDTIDLDALKAKKLVSKKTQRVKILADGTLNKSFTVYAEQFSVQAIKMITLTGGKAIQKK